MEQRRSFNRFSNVLGVNVQASAPLTKAKYLGMDAMFSSNEMEGTSILRRMFATSRKNIWLCPDPLELDGKWERLLREQYGRLLQSAGASTTRREADPDKLETFRVPGKGATGWVFWNGGADDVTVSRGGHSITIRPKHIGYLQIANGLGELQVREEL